MGVGTVCLGLRWLARAGLFESLATSDICEVKLRRPWPATPMLRLLGRRAPRADRVANRPVGQAVERGDHGREALHSLVTQRRLIEVCRPIAECEPPEL